MISLIGTLWCERTKILRKGVNNLIARKRYNISLTERKRAYNRDNRGVSPVIAVLLMVILTVLLAALVTYMFSLSTKLQNDLVEDTMNMPNLQDEIIIALNPTAGATDVKHSVVIEVESTQIATVKPINN